MQWAASPSGTATGIRSTSSPEASEHVLNRQPSGLEPGPDSGRRRTVSRLKRAQGRLTALIAAVGSGADCRNVVTQLSAARGALDKAGFELKSTLEEIHTLFLRLT